ncbi:ribonuclease Z [Alkalihalophilus lindianensis]|uniref:Ribonuclease Z n=1 Tax=Alkalihalophilus lindianensis TaxID=1630542 RepID=A0ABU3X6J6_9BACI|nr:ribonuclease Z [Alkalihalophilus lindianensis]MDV2683524.1 ribonuclease Z [Alkalihalophilus lindianensis]
MEFHFLGTGSGVPAIERNVSALALRFLQQKGTQWLFDCGEATQHQLLHSPITLTKIDRIFITHLHGDHIFGLPGLLGSRSFQGARSPLTIYGPKGLATFIDASLTVSRTHLRYPYKVIEVEEGLVLETEDVLVYALELEHVMPCFAFKITEKDKPGKLDMGRLQSLNIPKGPIYQRIKEGKTVELEDGSKVNGKDFVGPPQKGRMIVIAGDTRPIKKMVDFSRGANVLVHEATFRGDKQEHAAQFGHSTIEEATALAKEAQVKTLILTHISSRYSGEEEEFELEAKHYFSNVHIAHDMMVYKLST